MSKHGLRGNTTKRESLRAQAFRMYGKTCNYCGEIGNEVDHVIELAAGGDDSIENLQVLCSPCHKVKTAKFNSRRLKGNRGVFSEEAAPRPLSMQFLSPTLVSAPPMADASKS
jgi:5-methylcytosine-specific restriction endonuclease McrA